VKVKCQHRQEMVIVGFTPPKGRRTGIGAILVGVREGGKLRYAGKVGTGFSNATLIDLSKRLADLVVDGPRVDGAPRMREARWVEPTLVAQVRFTEWTSDGSLRHPAFEGLRFDKPASEVRRETPEPTPDAKPEPRAAAKGDGKPRVSGIVISHPERVMDVATGLTKLDLARYAGAVADAMLPFVLKRPLMLLRCPGGTQTSVFRQSDRRSGKKSSCFVQKHSGQGLDNANLGQTVLDGEEALYVTSARDLVTLAQNNTVELHGWGSTLPKWQRPDWIVLDLDPDEALPFSRVVDAAFEVREALKSLGLESWVKTTGGKGLHVVAPIARRYDWDTVRKATQQIALLMTKAAPDRYVATMSKNARAGKIFVDYLRNVEGATAVLPYSARARPGLPVAVPIAWTDLRALDPQELTIATVPKLVAARRIDPWADLLGTAQTFPRELLAAASAIEGGVPSFGRTKRRRSS
jgi:bifunctional non-homologous end joining protein LigD